MFLFALCKSVSHMNFFLFTSSLSLSLYRSLSPPITAACYNNVHVRSRVVFVFSLFARATLYSSAPGECTRFNPHTRIGDCRRVVSRAYSNIHNNIMQPVPNLISRYNDVARDRCASNVYMSYPRATP